MNSSPVLKIIRRLAEAPSNQSPTRMPASSILQSASQTKPQLRRRQRFLRLRFDRLRRQQPGTGRIALRD